MSPGIEDAARFVGNEAKRALNDAKDSGRNVLNDTKAAGRNSAFDVPGAMVASTLKNGGGLGLKLLVFRPAEWVFKFTSAMAVGGVKTGLQLASLIPIPLPGGTKNVAQMRASVGDFRAAINLGARGDPRKLSDIMQDIRKSRAGSPTPASEAPSTPPPSDQSPPTATA